MSAGVRCILLSHLSRHRLRDDDVDVITPALTTDASPLPQFPYYESGTHQWIFGAPDGHRDGVILVLTSDFPEPFAEW